MIKEQLSFSYQRKIFGPKYFFKIIILFVLIIILSWYGQKKTNNPFKAEPTIKIVRTNNEFTLFLHNPNDADGLPSIIMSLEGDIANHEMVKNIVKQTWYFISLGGKFYNDSLSPPEKVWIKQSARRKSMPSTWPQPYMIDNDTLTKNMIKRIYPFSDGRIAYLLSFNDISILYINGLETTCIGNETTRFNEKIELLLLSNASNEMIEQFRSLFRPHYVIVASTNNPIVSEYSNVVTCPLNRETITKFSIIDYHRISYIQ